jgi:peroxiredoxin
MIRNLTLVAAALSLALALPATAQQTTATAPAQKSGAMTTIGAGDTAPAFTLKDQTGKEHSLVDFKDKVVVLEWTNPGCPFVVYHLKENTTTDLNKKWKEKDVVWLKIDSSNFVTADAAQKAVTDNNIDVPVLLDASGTVGKSYGAKTTPHLFVIDKDGKVAYSGAYDDNPTPEKKDGVKNYVDAALEKVTAGEKPEVTHIKSYGCSVKYAK